MSVRCWLSALLIVSYAQVALAEVEFVSAEEAQRLKADFGRAHALSKKVLNDLIGRDLKCDMYGVRTRLQIERDVMLYRFHNKDRIWENQGAQVVHNYRISESDFVGRHGGLTDKIRFAKGRLISELTISTAQSNPVVLAYSVCNL